MGSTLIWMGQGTWDPGKKISSMVKAKKLGQMGLSMREIMCMEGNKGMGISNGPMDLFTSASSSTIISKG